MVDLLWPAVIVVFVGFVFVLVTRFVGLALGERDAEWGGDGETPLGGHAPPGAPA